MAEYTLNICPFPIPTGVRLEPPKCSAIRYSPDAELPLGALSYDAVVSLCADFQKAVLAKWEQQATGARLHAILEDDPT